MKYAIIAAGEGSRLVQEGVAAPKPLVKVGGEMLIDRLIRVFMDNNASEICVICNEQMTAVAEHLKEISEAGRVPLKYVVKSTKLMVSTTILTAYMMMMLLNLELV